MFGLGPALPLPFQTYESPSGEHAGGHSSLGAKYAANPEPDDGPRPARVACRAAPSPDRTAFAVSEPFALARSSALAARFRSTGAPTLAGPSALPVRDFHGPSGAS